MLNDFALERMLQDRSWNFGYAADAIIVRDLVLHPGGRFAGYSHANERAWRIAANALEFLSQAGAVTTRFDTVSVDETGRYHLSGKFLGEPNSTVTHTLYESDSIKPLPGQRNKTALLIPIHDAYFVYGINLLLQSFGADYDLIFIFSTQEDRVKFGAMHQMSSFVTYGSIILAEHLDAAGFEILGAKYSWPTFKQMLALTLAHASYDYLICVDAETFILCNVGWTDAATTIVDGKTWYGGGLPDDMGERNILRFTGTELPPVHDHAEVARVSVGFSVYTWWWDLPVFKCAHIPGFLKWVRCTNDNDFASRFGWSTFGHILYQYYTILYEDHELKKIDGIVHSLEFSRSEIVEAVHKKIAPVHWVNARAYVENPGFYRENGYLAVFHVDRKRFQQYPFSLPKL